MSTGARWTLVLVVAWMVALPLAILGLPTDWARIYGVLPFLVVLGLLGLAALLTRLLRLLRL